MPGNEPRRSVYVPSDMIDIWNDIVKTAKAERQGIGYIICKMWKQFVKKES